MADTRQSSLVFSPSANPVVDEYHGVSVADPYRWLEQLDSTETRSWIEEQRSAVATFFEQQPSYEAVRSRLTELWRFPKYSVPFTHGTWRFWWGQDLAEQDEFQPQPALYRQDISAGDFQVALDPNRLDKDGSAAITSYAVSADGSTLAYALSRGGSDWQEIRVLHLDSGMEEEDTLLWCKFPSIAWAPDNAGFFYNCYLSPDECFDERVRHGSNHVRFHRLGTSQSADRFIFTPESGEVICTPIVTEDGASLLIHLCKSAVPDDHLYSRPLESDDPFILLLEHMEAHFRYIGTVGRTCYLETDLAAPRGRVIAVDLAAPEYERYRVILLEQEECIAFSTLAGEYLLVGLLHHAWHRLVLYARDGTFVRELALPALGAITGISARRGDSEVFLSWESFLCPPTIYRYDLQEDQLTLLHAPHLHFDASRYETVQVFYLSQDGTLIPMFITRKRGLPCSGTAPTLLYAYGGFGMSVTPAFWLSQLCWLERGGIFAVANIRGGGEYGEEWHRAAVCESKQTSINDLVSGAQWLIEQSYTCPQHLAVMGMSNGGLLAAACLVQQPDLFGAVVCQGPLTDMLRYQRFTVGAHLVAEYGNAEVDAEQFRALLALSPLHNVRAGEAYPATLITTAENDLRAVPAHAMKFAAALQAASAGLHPILLCIDQDGGHSVGKPTSQRLDALSRILVFLLHTLDPKPASE